MKKPLSALLVLCILLTLLLGIPSAAAAEKKEISRTIAIVFDNSGSMYTNGRMAWCQATYAMEVFASMLNKGDTLLIYPMHPITVNGDEFTLDDPLKITDPKDASKIRNIVTPMAGNTPIGSVSAAADGLKKAGGDQKWLIVLTDGEYFNESADSTEKCADTGARLGEVLGSYLSENEKNNALYLGIKVADTVTSPTGLDGYANYAGQIAQTSAQVPSILTDMCNRIFGRDTLPASHNQDGKLSFDISMKKLIVFVQGENVSNVSINGGTLVSSTETRYAENGCTDSRYPPKSDTSLQGMLVTYENVPAGDYTVTYDGNVSSSDIEVYYEPDADLQILFTDSDGNPVNPNGEIYEGEYKVSWGMVDAKTGELIDSDLLGNPQYSGYLSTEGETDDPAKQKECDIGKDTKGMSGDRALTLKLGDLLFADITVNYLSGYTIHKTAVDLGWPPDGIKVIPIPADELTLTITGGDSVYKLTELEEGAHFTAIVKYGQEQLKGEALQSVKLTWDESKSGALITKDFQDDHYDLILSHKDPSNPAATPAGDYTVPIDASYTAPGSEEAKTKTPVMLSYSIEDDTYAIKVKLTAPLDYYQISKLPTYEPFLAEVSVNGAPLTDEELAKVSFTADCSGINFTAEPLPGKSAFAIQPQETDGLKDGKYKISCKAEYTDALNRASEDTAEVTVKLGTMAQWVKWAIAFGILLLLLLLLLLILNIKIFPRGFEPDDNQSEMRYNGRRADGVEFHIDRSGKQLDVSAEYNGELFGLSMEVRPGKDSRVKSSPDQLYAEALTNSLNVTGIADVKNVSIDGFRYTFDRKTGELAPTDKESEFFTIGDGSIISWDGFDSSGKKFSARVISNNK